jgi:hypothetical protein
MENDPEVGTEKAKYMFMSHHQNTRSNHDFLTDNECYENVATFKYLEITVINQSCIHKEIKCLKTKIYKL